MKGAYSFGLCILLMSFSALAYTLNIVTENFPDFQYLNEKGELIGVQRIKLGQCLMTLALITPSTYFHGLQPIMPH